MPPRGHSSSSHSSHSHSSRSHSSHSHSHSSHSSSSHYSSSRSSYRSPSYVSPYGISGNGKGYIVQRQLVNQPTGYRGRRATHHYGVRHNYTFFPESWTDQATGRSYNAGYYDENGQYYESVSFKDAHNIYDNVLFKCAYCGTKIHQKWSEGTTVSCPTCGASMDAISYLDQYTQDPHYTSSYRSTADNGFLRKLVSTFIIVGVATFSFYVFAAVAFMLIVSRNSYSSSRSVNDSSYEQSASVSNVDIFGKEVYLDNRGNNTYRITDKKELSERTMKWDYGYDSYYERTSDCYVWYNTDVSPNLWQYWYEGISSDYGDYGWMEYEPDGWYIETREGNWEKLPSKYDTSKLWHFEIDEDDFK